ncbi:MAG: hypothetical protein O7C75_02990 [Verrucomicrobia bacterium]|nr:hypothetical protein [Verrucomicrobiota bacterium]
MAAARALGRLGDQKAVDALLNYLSRQLSRTMEHVAIYALVEIAGFEETAAGLVGSSSLAQRRVLWALNGMSGSQLKAETVMKRLGSKHGSLSATAVSISKDHPEWAGSIAQTFQKWRRIGKLTENRLAAIKELAPLFLQSESMRKFVGRLIASSDVTTN